VGNEFNAGHQAAGSPPKVAAVSDRELPSSQPNKSPGVFCRHLIYDGAGWRPLNKVRGGKTPRAFPDVASGEEGVEKVGFWQAGLKTFSTPSGKLALRNGRHLKQ
jgi:hypothetical protein